MSFTCVQSAAAKKSLYFASHDKIARYKVYRFEEHAKDERQRRLRLHPAQPVHAARQSLRRLDGGPARR